MSPELRTAVQERIDLGYSKEQIEAELHAAGYDDATIDMVYQEVSGHGVADIPPAHEIPLSTEPVEHSPEPAPATSPQPTTTVSTLPSASDLFTQGWEFLTRRPELLVYLSLPNLIATLSLFFVEAYQPGLQGLIELLATIAYFIVLGMLLFTVTHSERDVSVNEAFAWVKANAGSYIWISILSLLVVWGGLLLFIIPGLIIGVYISLSQYVLAAEGGKGFAALKRSHELVKGNWWALAGRMLLLGLMTALIVIALFFVVGLVLSGLDESMTDLIVRLGTVVVSAAATMIFFHAYSRIYYQLAGGRPATVVEGGKGTYITLSILGLFFPIFIALIIAASAGLETDGGYSMQDVLQVQAQISVAGVQAETFENQNGSYEGVCAEIESSVTSAESVRCNDDVNAWALSARIGTDMWCIDSTGYNKRIEKSLGARTACLDLPAGQ